MVSKSSSSSRSHSSSKHPKTQFQFSLAGRLVLFCYDLYMKEILFASSNQSKLEQFQYVADAFGIKVKIISVYQKFPAIKPYDEEYRTQFEIVEKGAREVYAQTKQPIVVEDTILEVDVLHGLPGLHASEYLKEKGREGLLKDLEGANDRAARITSIVGYFDGQLFISSKERCRRPDRHQGKL